MKDNCVAMRKRRHIALAALLALTISGQTEVAKAEGFDVQNFNPMANLESDFFSTSSSSVTEYQKWSAYLGASYATNPLVFRGTDGEILGSPVEQIATTNLLFSIGLFPRVELGLDVPLVLRQEGWGYGGPGIMAEQASFGVGDLRLVPKVNLYNGHNDRSQRGFGVALLLDTHLPTGRADTLQGGDFRVGPRVALDAMVSDNLLMALNVGYKFREDREHHNLRIGDTLGWNAALEYEVRDNLRLTSEVFGRLSPTAGRIIAAESPVEFLGGLKYSIGPITLAAAGGTGLVSGYGAPGWRGFFAIGHTPQTYPAVATTPMLMASLDEEEPLQTATLRRQCEDPQDCEALAPAPSCEDDKLRHAAGRCEEGSCLFDIIIAPCGSENTCGTINEMPACVSRPMVHFDRDRLELVTRDAVLFETAAAHIDARSYALLDEVVELMDNSPQIKLLQIEGHTDNTGGLRYNRHLSEIRAISVMVYLRERGVHPKRMTAVGMGPEHPIASNETEEGRSMNRRVVFRVLELAEDE